MREQGLEPCQPRPWRHTLTEQGAAHRRLGRPIVLVWDNLNIHRCAQMLAFIAANALWLTVIRLPSYSPDLNPVEGVWSLLKRGEIANRVLVDVD
ncbi:transposase, partial [Frankia sp. AgPm24]|uniref:transposase n=1 Tax=Frankia sp. AgPm24 TaxID=631128 RepID=UPI0035B1F773